MRVRYQQNKGEEIELSGQEVQTLIMTDLFRDAMFSIANERGSAIYSDDMLEALQLVQQRGYTLAIVSGMRLDIITGLLSITQCHLRFDISSMDRIQCSAETTMRY